MFNTKVKDFSGAQDSIHAFVENDGSTLSALYGRDNEKEM